MQKQPKIPESAAPRPSTSPTLPTLPEAAGKPLSPILRGAASLALAMLLQGCLSDSRGPDASAAYQVALERLERSQGSVSEARPIVRARLAKLSRLRDSAFLLLAANADVCPRTRPSGGFDLESMWERSFSMPLFEGIAHREALGMDGTHFVVSHVSSGSPAERAGLRVGDRLLKVEGSPVPVPASQRAHARAKERAERMVRRGGEDGRLALGVMRQGRALTVEMGQAVVCDYPVRLLRSERVNAFANGRAIFVTDGMLEFLHTDMERQAIIAHELAHNVAGHAVEEPISVRMDGAGVGLAARAPRHRGLAGEAGLLAYSQGVEREADYLGSYFMARAGIDVQEAPNVWRRFADLDPEAIEHASTHPATADRLANLQAAVREIESKRRAGLPSVPTSLEAR